MLEFHQGNTGETFVVTLNELVTIDDPNYLFYFTHIETKQTVAIVLNAENEQSDHPYRYNQFEFNTAILFNNKPTGLWNYEVYQQSSLVNIIPEDAGGLIESGKMILYPASDFEFEKYNEPVTFKTYNG